jgi:hypothetical protein
MGGIVGLDEQEGEGSIRNGARRKGAPKVRATIRNQPTFFERRELQVSAKDSKKPELHGGHGDKEVTEKSEERPERT